MVKINGTKSNLGKFFKQEKVITGKLAFPVFPVAVPLAIDMGARVEGDIDAVDEEGIEEAYEAKVKQVMGKLAQEVEKALTAALRAPVWNWRSGARDIYDTGELARSVNIAISGTGISVSYSAPHASIVHNGGYIFPYGNKSARPIYLPPRPWIQSVLYGGGPVPKFDLEGFMAENLN